MSLKGEFTKIVLMFIIQIVITIFTGYFFIMGDYVATMVLCMCLAGVFSLMLVKGKRMRRDYPEAFRSDGFK